MRSLLHAAALISAFFLIAVVAGIAFLIWGGTVKNRYADYAQADADQPFARGWLPPVIPRSSREIVTKNNLDLNLSEGGFRFDREDLETFVSHLKKVPVPDSGHSEVYEYEGWTFFISPGEKDIECNYRFRMPR